MIKSKTKILILIIIVVLFAISVFLYVKRKPKSPSQDEIPSAGADFETLIPGISQKNEAIEKLGEPLNDINSDTLKFESNNPNLPTQVVAEDQTIIFIKEIITAEDNKTSEEIISKYGVAPYTLFGSDSVNGFNLYAYPEKGLAYLGHIKEPIVLEIWYFQPTSFNNFKQKWASDYSTIFQPKQ